MSKIIAFIPARDGSKSIPGKNVKIFAGKPLIQWTVNEALSCSQIDAVYVSTDSDAVRNALSRFGYRNRLHIVSRSPETATDTATTETAMLEFAKTHEFDYIVLIQPTSPLVWSVYISAGINEIVKMGFDSALSVVRQKRFIWGNDGASAKPVNYVPHKRPRRQDIDGYLVENGAFYITSKAALIEHRCRISGRIAAVEMRPETYIELDELHDWKAAESYAMNRIVKDLKNIKLLVMDVDGVLTDGGMYYSEHGDELKKFNTRDGMGIARLQSANVIVVIITKEETCIVEWRCQKLKINYVYQGEKDKAAVLSELCLRENISPLDVVYIGDDLNDLDAMRLSGFSACPSDAVQTIKHNASYICNAPGGGGCVREICDMIFDAKTERGLR